MATSTIPMSTMMGSFKTTTISASYSCAANSAVTVTASGSEPGWTPIGMVGGRLGYNSMFAYAIIPTFTVGSASVKVMMRNVSSTASGSRSASFIILWTR